MVRKERFNKKWRFLETLILCIIIMLMSCGSSLSSSPLFVSLFTLFLFIIFVIKGGRFRSYFIIILFIWILINITSYCINKSSSFPLISFLGASLRMLIIPYFVFFIFRESFFDFFYEIAYKLVVISLFFYIIDLCIPSLFSTISPFLNFITADEQRNMGGCYLFVYMHSAWQGIRNCGFMWEPGAYSMMLIFLLLYHWSKNNCSFDFPSFIIITSIISTFSTAGYLALFIVIVFAIINIHATSVVSLIGRIILLIILFTGGIVAYNKIPFMRNKIEGYIVFDTNTWTMETNDNNTIQRVTRLGYFKIVAEGSLSMPQGNGVLDNSYIVNKYGYINGPGAISEIMLQMGWPGLILIFYSLFWFGSRLFKKKNMGLAMLLSITTLLFSNPFVLRYIIFVIIYMMFEQKYYLSYQKKKYNTACLTNELV